MSHAQPSQPASRAWPVYTAGLVALDALMIGAALGVAGQIYPTTERPLAASLVFIPMLLLLFWHQGAYQRRYLLGGPVEYSRVFSGASFGLLAAFLAGYFLELFPMTPTDRLVLFWACTVLFVGVGRFAMRRIAYRSRRDGHFITTVLIAGVDMHSAAIAHQLHAPMRHGAKVLGFIDDFLPVGTDVVTVDDGTQLTKLKVLGPIRVAQELAETLGAGLLIVNSNALPWESAHGLMLEAVTPSRKFEVRLVALPYDILTVGVESVSLAHVPLIRLNDHRLMGVDYFLRRAFDISLASVLLLAGLPFVSLVLARARFYGVRPFFERCTIIGQRGVAVRLLLLSRQVTKRLLLRGWPAMLLVLVGRLSIVGPRPRSQVEWDALDSWSNSAVQTVTAGLTGPWRFSEGPLALEQDLWYVRNYTIWQDLFYLWKTAAAVLKLGGLERSTRLTRWEAGDARPLSEASGSRAIETVSATSP